MRKKIDPVVTPASELYELRKISLDETRSGIIKMTFRDQILNFEILMH